MHRAISFITPKQYGVPGGHTAFLVLASVAVSLLTWFPDEGSSKTMMLFPPSVVPSQLQLVHVTGTSTPATGDERIDELLDEPLWPLTSAAAANMVPSPRSVLLNILLLAVETVLGDW